MSTATAQNVVTLRLRSTPVELTSSSLGRLLIDAGTGVREAIRLRPSGELAAFRDGVLPRAVRSTSHAFNREALRDGLPLSADECKTLDDGAVLELLAQWLSAGGSSPFGTPSAPCAADNAIARWVQTLDRLEAEAAATRQRLRDSYGLGAQWRELMSGASVARRVAAEQRNAFMQVAASLDSDWRQQLGELTRRAIESASQYVRPSVADLVHELCAEQFNSASRALEHAEEARLEQIRGWLSDIRPPFELDGESQSAETPTVAVRYTPIVELPSVPPLEEQLAPVVRRVTSGAQDAVAPIARSLQRLEAQQAALADEQRVYRARQEDRLRRAERLTRISVTTALVGLPLTLLALWLAYVDAFNLAPSTPAPLVTEPVGELRPAMTAPPWREPHPRP